MRTLLASLLLLSSLGFAQSGPEWVAASDAYTHQLLDIQLKHQPENGSRQGLKQFDALVSQPTSADEDRQRKEEEALMAKFKAAAAKQKFPEVTQDLEILMRRMELDFREQDYERAHKVPWVNASMAVFGGVRGLLDEQVAAERRPAAVARMKKYAGLEPGFRPLTEILKERVREQMAKPGIVFPARVEIETEMARNANYLDGIEQLCKQYKLVGWEAPFAKLKAQLVDYDAWIKQTVLPKARTDFRLPPEEYALNLEDFGLDLKPAEIAALAHKGFDEIQAEMQTIAAQVAKERKLPSPDYRDVLRELKKQQIVGDAILPFYEKRLGQIEVIIREHDLVALPSRPARIRIASAAETAATPAPHMTPPPFLHNTGEKGEFVLPLNVPGGAGEKPMQYDDYTYDAVAWTLTAHEARPGHELQFDSMVEHGVSLARAMYAFNSTNAEGWGLYSEYLVKPYMPLEGQLASLNMRLLRAARAFIDPELQMGKLTPEQAHHILEVDVVHSNAAATAEVERYTFRSPGQATSYFYGYTKLLALRKDVEAKMGAKFNQRKFHDFLLAQGLLPPDLLRKAVMEEFVKGQ